MAKKHKKRKQKNLARAKAYYNQGLKSHDWDFHYLEQDILFKLKRIEHELKTSGIAKHCRTTFKSLRRTIELFEKLIDIEVQYKFYKEFDIQMTRLEDGKLEFTYSHDYEVAKQICLEYYNYLESTAFLLLKKYRHYWWD